MSAVHGSSGTAPRLSAGEVIGADRIFRQPGKPGAQMADVASPQKENLLVGRFYPGDVVVCWDDIYRKRA